MKQYTLGEYTLDEFADYLNGENDFFDGVEGNELVISGEHHLSKTLNLNVPIVISGDNAVITGDRTDEFAFSLTCTNTAVKNLQMKNIRFGIEVDARGKCVENVLVSGISMQEGLRLVEVGSTKSNSILRNIKIQDCVATVAHEDYTDSDSESGEMALTYNICCARHAGGESVDNCLLEGVVLDNCKKIGVSTAGISIVTGMPMGTNYTAMGLHYSNLVIRDVAVSNNFIDTCWDCSLVVIGAFINTGTGVVENIKICNNHIKYGIGAIGVTGGGHHFGDRGRSVVRDVVISGNTVERSIQDVGEPCWGIWLFGSRDYFPNTTTHDHLIENVEISHNTVKGAGIAIKGSYVLYDFPSVQVGNSVRNVKVCHNAISGADYAFELYGVDVHGRLYDWNYGYPRHDQKWGEEIENDDVITTVSIGNKLVDIAIEDNVIDGYRYRVRACGAKAHGHGICVDNKVVEGITFARNEYRVGENHIHVAGIIADDFVRDGGGNEVCEVFKIR